jgi:lysyl-tRNA synthetase class 2
MARVVARVLTGRTEGGRQFLWERTLPVLAATVMALLMGAMEILAGLGVEPGGALLRAERRLIPLSDVFSGSSLMFLGGMTLYLAYQLWMRKRAAAVLFSLLLLLQANLLGIRYHQYMGAAACFLASLFLMCLREEFPVVPDPASTRRLKLAAPAMAASYYVICVAVMLLTMRGSGLPRDIWEVLLQPLVIAAGGTAGYGSAELGGTAQSLLLLLCMALLVWAGRLLFRPQRPEREEGEERREKARELVRRKGSDTIAYFSLRKDKNLFFLGDQAFLSYRCVGGGTALVSGDPIGPAELIPELLANFRNFCLMRGWRVAFLGASRSHLDSYAAVDLRALCYGEEAVIDLAGFTLEGRKNKSLRHAVAKWGKAGARMEFMFNASIPEHLRLELCQISADWRGDNPETGFSMGLGRLMSSEDPDCLLALAYDREDRPVGFTYLVPVYPDHGFSLDITRTSLDAGNGINEFIFARTALFLQEQGYRCLSLHFAAFSHHYRGGREEKGSALVRSLCRFADRFLPVMSLYEFDRKFDPRWERRYLVMESWLDLPRVGAAALATESFHRLRRAITKKNRAACRG